MRASLRPESGLPPPGSVFKIPELAQAIPTTISPPRFLDQTLVPPGPTVPVMRAIAIPSQAPAIFSQGCCSSLRIGLPASSLSPPNPSTTGLPSHPAKNASFSMSLPWSCTRPAQSVKFKGLHVAWKAPHELPWAAIQATAARLSLPHLDSPLLWKRVPAMTRSLPDQMPPPPCQHPQHSRPQRCAQHWDRCLSLCGH